jgi:imidazolonepropionase-like amidohydrolase
MPATAHDRRRVRTAIRAAALFDGTASTRLADAVVLIEDGRITDVQAGPRAAVPADAELIELPGGTLLPGLIDTHVHLAFDASPAPVDALAGRDDEAVLDAMAAAAAAQLAAGVTTVRDLGDLDYLAVRLRAQGAPDGSPLPTIVAAGPPITTGAGHCHFLGGAAEGVDGVRAAVREHVERGVDVIKVMASGGEMTPGTSVHLPQYPADELRALAEEAHRHGLPVTAHAHSTVAIADALAARVDGIEHCSFRTADGVYAPAELINGVAAQSVAVGGTLGGIASEFAPPAHLLALLPLFIANLRRLYAAGAVIVVGTDAGIAPPKPHGVLPYGIEQLTQLGMSNAEALRAGTSVAATVCGLANRKGRLAAGFDADLLAVDGDPLADISALHRPVAVFAGGRPVARVPEPVR